ncbi:unnamed protein product [Effrenium voratum]|nr:unnamed protein product [Effrenium voratum]
MNYSKGWFLFDLAVVGIDWVSWIPNALGDGGEGFLKSLRSARYLRALRSARLLRLAKTSKLNVMLENYVIAMGRQWLILAFNVMKMLGWIGLTAHLLACTWFGVGMLVSQSRESWVDLAMVSSSEGHVQYIHALAWIIQPPSPPEMGVLGVNSFAERCVSILLVIVTVLVIGSALSILTGTVRRRSGPSTMREAAKGGSCGRTFTRRTRPPSS